MSGAAWLTALDRTYYNPAGDLAAVAAANPRLALLLDRLGEAERRLRAVFTVSDEEATDVAVAAAAADGGLDWRDTTLTVEDLLAAAAERGVDTTSTLADAVGWGSAPLAELITARWLRPAGTGGPPPPR